jgi:hypothetical protein
MRVGERKKKREGEQEAVGGEKMERERERRGRKGERGGREGGEIPPTPTLLCVDNLSRYT